MSTKDISMLDVIWNASHFSNKAYEMEALMPGFYGDLIHYYRDPDYQSSVYIFLVEGVQYVAFPGTNDLKDVHIDLQILKTNVNIKREEKKVGEARVHRGFYKAYRNLEHHIFDNIDNKYPVVFCGHSLGGALAAVACLRMIPTKLITFGQPRVGGPKFADYLNRTLGKSNYLRYCLQSDTVPHVPKLGYHHGGTCYYIDKQNKLHLDPGKGRMFWDRFLTFSERLKDHSMREYDLAVLETLREGQDDEM